MAGEVTEPLVTVLSSDSVYRGINPHFYQQGQLLSGVFFLKKKHRLEEGPSVGIVRLISLPSFHSRMGEGWGVGELSVSVPQSQNLNVQSLPDSKWAEYAHAHAVITDYQKLSDKVRNDVARVLRDALQKNILVSPAERTTTK